MNSLLYNLYRLLKDQIQENKYEYEDQVHNFKKKGYHINHGYSFRYCFQARQLYLQSKELGIVLGTSQKEYLNTISKDSWIIQVKGFSVYINDYLFFSLNSDGFEIPPADYQFATRICKFIIRVLDKNWEKNPFISSDFNMELENRPKPKEKVVEKEKIVYKNRGGGSSSDDGFGNFLAGAIVGGWG